MSYETEAEAPELMCDSSGDEQGSEDIADDTFVLRLKPAEFVFP
jgi:hypothetical protein